MKTVVVAAIAVFAASWAAVARAAPAVPLATPVGGPPGNVASDVDFVARTVAAFEELDARAQLLDVSVARDTVARALWDSCVRVAREQGVKDGGEAEWRALRPRVVEAARQLVERWPVERGPQRTEALWVGLQLVSTDALASRLVASWLGFEPTEAAGTVAESATVAANAKAKAASVPLRGLEALSSRPVASSSDSELARAAGTAAASTRGASVSLHAASPAEQANDDDDESGGPVAVQVVPFGPKGAPAGVSDVALEPAATRLLAERGGAGAGNGLVDLGEWVHLKVSLRSRGSLPWFSTSAWIESVSGCAWVPSGREHAVSEFDGTGGLGTTSFWVYVSKACGPGARRFQVMLKDTHRAVEGTSVTFDLLPVEARRPQLVNARFDADVPGASDGSLAESIRPGVVFEYSTDLDVGSSSVKEAAVAYHFPDDIKSLFESAEYRDEPLVKEPGSSILRAADDLDVAVVGAKQFRDVIRALKPSAIWSTRVESNRLWLAVDSTLSIDSPMAPAAPRGPGGTKAARPASPASLPVKAILELARRHIGLRARPAQPRIPGSLAATEGYEVTLDAEAMAAEYATLVAPASSGEPAAEPDEPPLEYRFRSYVALPLIHLVAPQATPQPPVAEARTEEVSEEADPPQGPQRPPSEVARPFRVDLGGGWWGSLMSAPSRWNAVPLVHSGGAQLRFSWGSRLAFTAVTSVAGGSVSALSLVEGFARDRTIGSVDVTAFRIAAGLGYNWSLGTFEFTPHATVGYRLQRASFRWLSGVVLDLDAHGAEVVFGSVARFGLTEGVSLFIDAAVHIGTPNSELDTNAVLTGHGLRAVVGLSVAL